MAGKDGKQCILSHITCYLVLHLILYCLGHRNGFRFTTASIKHHYQFRNVFPRLLKCFWWILKTFSEINLPWTFWINKTIESYGMKDQQDRNQDFRSGPSLIHPWHFAFCQRCHKTTPTAALRGHHGQLLPGSAAPTSHRPGILCMGGWSEWPGTVAGVIHGIPSRMQSAVCAGDNFPWCCSLLFGNHRSKLTNGYKIILFLYVCMCK